MKQRGFTLIELLVTLAIAAIFATVAVPSFSNFLARQQLASDVNEVISVLSFARSEAIKQRTEVSVEISDGKPWSITIMRGNDTIRKAEGRRQAVTMATNSDCGGILTFNALGAASEACELTVEHEDAGQKVVTVSRAGGIRSDD